jgi:hypothetical protein
MVYHPYTLGPLHHSPPIRGNTVRFPFFSMTLIIALWASSAAFSQAKEEQCTSAVILPEGSLTQGPVLWKNRDTETLSNQVVFVDELPFDYLGLVNAGSPSGRTVWAGLNSVGFGIINTVAYNLPKKSKEMKDLEGIIMADALRTCRTVDDFETYLAANLGPELGSLANFGVIDGQGGAMLFEVHNHGFEKIDPSASHNSCLINTNFARTGKKDDGAGYLRFERATSLFRDLPDGPVDFRTILTRFTRDTGHALVDQPTPFELKNVPGSQPLWVNTRDTINKAYTSAAVILVGRNPDDPASVATMWVIPGEPVTAVAVPLWVEALASPKVLAKGEKAAMWEESARLKKMARPFDAGGKGHYLDLTALDNAEGTGYLPKLLAAEAEILAKTEAFLEGPHTALEYRKFQEEMSDFAYKTLKSVK